MIADFFLLIIDGMIFLDKNTIGKQFTVIISLNCASLYFSSGAD
jgi:hypothetical protein